MLINASIFIGFSALIGLSAMFSKAAEGYVRVFYFAFVLDGLAILAWLWE